MVRPTITFAPPLEMLALLNAQEGSIWKRRVYHWRAAMEYFLIGMWRQCVPLLDQYDVVGAITNQATSCCAWCSRVQTDRVESGCAGSVEMRAAALGQWQLPKRYLVHYDAAGLRIVVQRHSPPFVDDSVWLLCCSLERTLWVRWR